MIIDVTQPAAPTTLNNRKRKQKQLYPDREVVKQSQKNLIIHLFMVS